MGKQPNAPIDRSRQRLKQGRLKQGNLKRGLTLIEIVVAITILGIVGTMIGSILVSMSQSYIENRNETVSELEIRIALLQIERALMNAYPSTIEISNDPKQIRFKTAVVLGEAEIVGDGYLIDASQPNLAKLSSKMELACFPIPFSSPTYPIQSIDAESNTVRVTGFTDRLPKSYAVFDSQIRIVWDNNALKMEKTVFTNDSSPSTGTLCHGVQRFNASWIGSELIHLVIVKQDSGGVVYSLERSVPLRWGGGS